MAIYHCSIKIISRGKGRPAVAAGFTDRAVLWNAVEKIEKAKNAWLVRKQGGEWGAKQKKEYILDRDGNKIYDPKKRQYKCKSIPATDWNEQTKARNDGRQGRIASIPHCSAATTRGA